MKGVSDDSIWGQSVVRCPRLTGFLSKLTQFVFVLDVSPSMDCPVEKGSSRTRMDSLKEAIKESMDCLRSFKHADKVVISIILFSASAWVNKRRMSVFEILATESGAGLFNELQDRSTTAIGTGIRLAAETFEEVQTELGPDANKRGAFFILSDGQENMNSGPVNAADELKKKGHLLFTVAFGESADRELLRKIASKPDWACEAHSMKQLLNVFKAVTRTASRVLGVQ